MSGRPSRRWVSAIASTPEKQTLYQVGPDIAWSSGHDGTCVRIFVGFRIEGGMNLGE